ncbi:helix-turn-helix domain-containing protein [Georgenia faecalis]|uniref:helix-turn-helix domain-containing protein n=1 Tax=Georgenia faecalis TaxID=2483799 RepID=UPI0013DFE423|nr:helix-turn-helix domain-containing protein [Georgenia faecalis]
MSTTTAASALTVHDVAAQLGVSEKTVRQMTRRGELVGFKAGRGGKTSPYRYRQTQIDAHIATREAATRAGRTA